MSTDKTDIVATIDEKTPLQLFGNGQALDIYEQIDGKVRPLVFDLTTEKGKTQLRSTDRKVAMAKNKLDGIAKDYIAELEKPIRDVKKMRSELKTKFEDLQTFIKAPLAEIEAKEAEDKKHIMKSIEAIRCLGDSVQNGVELSVEQLEQKQYVLEQLEVTTDEFGDYVKDALEAKALAHKTLQTSLQAARTLAENQRLREQVAQMEGAEPKKAPTSAKDVLNAVFPKDHPVNQTAVDEPPAALAIPDEATQRRESLAALQAIGFDEATGKQLIGAVHKGLIPHMKMAYQL